MQNLNTVRRILSIDDNDAIHGDFKKILMASAPASKLGGMKAKLFGALAPATPSAKVTFEVDCALQGEEGLSKVKQAFEEGRPYAVAFVDMRMPPGWDGLQTIQRLWEVDADLQVVICSAFSDYSWDEVCDKLGLTDRLLILKKPFDPAEVTQLATALSEKRLLLQTSKLKMDELEGMVQIRTVELTHLAQHDKLTGLANRVLFNAHLDKAVQKSKGDPSYRFAVLFLDFDRFKVINDSLGHDAGDAVLKGIADRISAALKLAGPVAGNALAARLGGDEFTILIDGPADTLAPHAFAEALLRLLDAPYKVGNGSDVHCTASIGLTDDGVSYENAEDALRDADTAMYHAKATGRARCVVFDQKMHDTVTARLELENDLRRAIDGDDIGAHYQPIVCLSTGRLKGFEALARWQHPRRGMVPPLEFIPCCEELGLIGKLGLSILSKACTQLKKWTDQFAEWSDLTMSVNLSTQQLKSPLLVEQITRVLHDTGVRPEALVLEITESAMITDPEAAIETLKQIRALGVRLHLDDFGTGYSSLSALHRFPLDGLKIDRSFINNLSERRDYMAVVHAIISLARHLGMTLIAEGIENENQLTLLQSLNCDFAQGYFFARPMDATGAETYLLEHRTKVIRQAA